MQSDALPTELPISEALRAYAIPLDHLGDREVAWPRDKALEIVCVLQGTTWAVLGGDVLVQRDGAFRHSYDNWYSDRRPDEAALDFVGRSHRETRDYIERYQEKETLVSYVLVFDRCI